MKDIIITVRNLWHPKDIKLTKTMKVLLTLAFNSFKEIIVVIIWTILKGKTLCLILQTWEDLIALKHWLKIGIDPQTNCKVVMVSN